MRNCALTIWILLLCLTLDPALILAADLPKKTDVRRINLRNNDPSSSRQKLRSTYGIRKSSLRGVNRADIIEELGGSTQTESAVEQALDWLTRMQRPEGHWEETQSKVAHTGLAILVYLSYGVQPQDPTPYGKALNNALRWLCAQVPENGNMRDGGQMYGQAIGTLALGEALGVTNDPAYRPHMTRAVNFLIRAQNPESGGWRYQPHPSLTHGGDLSVTGWVIMALRSAEMADMRIPDVIMAKAVKFLNSVSNGRHQGKYGYKDKLPNFSMTSVGMYCQQLFGRKSDSERQIESAAYLHVHLPDERQEHYYYWYYGTLATFLHGGEVWQNWNSRMTPILLANQNKDGSWSPAGDRAKREGTHVTTCWAALSLTVYYRYLPMLNGYKKFDLTPRALQGIRGQKPNPESSPRIDMIPGGQPKD